MTRSPAHSFGKGIDWGSLAPLRLRAKTVAEGVYAGAHRSRRRGPGVEFGGHRAYVPGDDLRWIDRHALMRHDRLLVREFEAETDRGLHLLVDATASMGFRSEAAPGAKVAFAAVIAAALARIALASGDPVSLSWIGGQNSRPLPPASGRESFDRVVRALEAVQAVGDVARDARAAVDPLTAVARRARHGSTIVLLSDLIDVPDDFADAFASLGTSGRRTIAVQVLDPEERLFPFEGTVRLRSLEGGVEVETDAQATRQQYLDGIAALGQRWASVLQARGGRLVACTTTDDPIDRVRAILRAIAEGPA